MSVWAPRRLGSSDVYRWCLQLVLVLPLAVLRWRSCLYQSLFYLNTKRVRHDLEKKNSATTDSLTFRFLWITCYELG
jgi:hypothetical protein